MAGGGIQNPKSSKPDETDDLDDLANEISKAISLTRERRRAKRRLMEQSGPDTGVGWNRDDVPIELESTDDLDDLANEISKAISLTREKLRAKFHLVEQSGQDGSDHGGSGLNREHSVLIEDVLPKTKSGSECYISRRGKGLKKGIRKVLTAGENAAEYHMRRVNAPEKEKALSNIFELDYYEEEGDDEEADRLIKAISLVRERRRAQEAEFHSMEQSCQDISVQGINASNREAVPIEDILPKTKDKSECHISRRGKGLKKGIRKVLTAGENAAEYHMRCVNAPEKEKALSNIFELDYYEEEGEDEESDRLFKAISLVRERRRAQVAEFHSMEQSCQDISVQGINASNREAVPIEDILPKTKDKSECHISREPTAPSSGRTEIVDGNSNQMEKNGYARKLGKKPKKEYKTKQGKVLRLFTRHNIHPWAQVKRRKLVPRQRRQAQLDAASAPISGFDTCSAPNSDFDDVDIKWWNHMEYEGDEEGFYL